MSPYQRSLIHLDLPIEETSPRILILNGSAEMAKLVTSELLKSVPGAKLLYAPSIAIAEWLITTRRFHLIISDAILPDGNISRLNRSLSTLENLPDLIVVGEKNFKGKQILLDKTYSLQKISDMQSEVKQSKVAELGADLRNDLNNPLQQIVAMAFVARSAQGASELTNEALGAIESAAQSMAGVVWGIEEKLLKALNS